MSSARSYWVETTPPLRRPHAMPVCGIWLEGSLYFSSAQYSKKARNLYANTKIAIHLERDAEVAILEDVVT